VKLSRAAIALYIGLVFVCGAVLGAFGQRLYTASKTASMQRPNPEEYRKQAITEFQSRLNLDDNQVAQLNMIMDETKARVMETRRQMHPAYQKIHEEQNQKFRQILRPEQQLEFDKFLKEREERNKQHGGRGPGAGGL
jgi:Spy/CpxP family protein refolding chaperone